MQPIFSVSGDFSAQNLDGIQFISVNALKNDGSGMGVPVKLSLSPVGLKVDTESPEDFNLTVANDPSVFDGRYFLVFAAQDKGSGVDHYEVKEGRWGRFRKAESPYFLTHQNLNRDVYVKAVDKAGNERVAVTRARVHNAWWESYRLFAILIVLVLIALAYKKQWLRFTK